MAWSPTSLDTVPAPAIISGLVDGDGASALSAVQVAAAAQTLGEAFQQDPLFAFVFPDQARREQLLPWLFAGLVRYGLRYGRVEASPGLEGVAIWLGPERAGLTMAGEVRSGLWQTPFRCRPGELARLLRCALAIDRLHRRALRGPHFYLLALGVRPRRQRQGIGSALLAPSLGEATHLGLPCYLETANQANLAFYGRHGFQVVAMGVVAGRGPRLWGMVRPPP